LNRTTAKDPTSIKEVGSFTLITYFPIAIIRQLSNAIYLI